MLDKLLYFFIFIFNFIPRQQKIVLSHILQISTVSPENFTYDSIADCWESEKLGIRYYPDTGNVYIRKVKYTLTGKAKRNLTNHFKNINLMIHHQTIGQALLEDSLPSHDTVVLKPKKTELNLEKYANKIILAKLRSGKTIKGKVKLRDFDTMYRISINSETYLKCGRYYASITESSADIISIQGEEEGF